MFPILDSVLLWSPVMAQSLRPEIFLDENHKHDRWGLQIRSLLSYPISICIVPCHSWFRVLVVWMMKCTGLRAVKFAASWRRCTCLESIVWHAYQFASFKLFFFWLNSWRRLHCTRIRAQLLYPRLDFADSAVAKLTRKKNWSACPFQWVIRLPSFPYLLMKLFLFEFSGNQTEVDSGGEWCML